MGVSAGVGGLVGGITVSSAGGVSGASGASAAVGVMGSDAGMSVGGGSRVCGSSKSL